MTQAVESYPPTTWRSGIQRPRPQGGCPSCRAAQSASRPRPVVKLILMGIGVNTNELYDGDDRPTGPCVVDIDQLSMLVPVLRLIGLTPLDLGGHVKINFEPSFEYDKQRFQRAKKGVAIAVIILAVITAILTLALGYGVLGALAGGGIILAFYIPMALFGQTWYAKKR